MERQRVHARPIRIVPPPPAERQGTGRRPCLVCGEGATGGKPLCRRHCLALPYPAELVRHEEEARKAKKAKGEK